MLVPYHEYLACEAQCMELKPHLDAVATASSFFPSFISFCPTYMVWRSDAANISYLMYTVRVCACVRAL
jgi:hypothetical protein